MIPSIPVTKKQLIRWKGDDGGWKLGWLLDANESFIRLGPYDDYVLVQHCCEGTLEFVNWINREFEEQPMRTD